MKKPLGQFLSVDGAAPAANTEADYFMTGNYATTTDFWIEPPPGVIYEIEELRIVVEDNNPIAQNSYGADIVLTGSQGILVQVELEGVVTDLTSGQLIQTFWGWERIADGGPNTFGGDYQVAVLNFRKKYGSPLVLNPGDKLKLPLNGNFTGLVTGGGHTAYASGNQRGT